MEKELVIVLLPETMAICRLGSSEPIPAWALVGSFLSITRTSEELSIVCLENNVPSQIQAERAWRAFKVRGPLDFTLTGVLLTLAAPLAQAGVPLFAVSTYDTDYILVKATDLESAIAALSKAGHSIEGK